MFRSWLLLAAAAVGTLAFACGGEKAPPLFGPYTFALDVDADGDPVDVVDTVPGGLDFFYVFVDYAGMSDGLSVGLHCINTDVGEDFGPTEYSTTWEFGSEGTLYFGCGPEDGSPLPPGPYDIYITTLDEAGEEVILADNDPAADIFVEEASESYPTPEDAIAAAITAAGAEYAGDCAGTEISTDVGKFCSGLQDQQGDVLAYLIGPTFSEFTDWYFVEGSPAVGYAILDIVPFDPSASEIPYP